MWRSKCYSKLRKLRKAIDDVDAALHIDSLYKEVRNIRLLIMNKSEYKSTSEVIIKYLRGFLYTILSCILG